MTDDLDKTTTERHEPDDLEQTSIAPQETYEPADAAAPAASVLPPGASVAGGGTRWAIAAGVVVLVLLATALTIGLFTGRAANATVLGYVPSDSIMYGEIRMDLPGDQRANLGAFLSKFPGFADQSTIETKIDEVLDRLVSSASDGEQTYSTDVKPWFGGEVAFSVGALPDPATFESAPEGSGMDDARFLILLSIKDGAVAQAWLDGVLAESGMSTFTESYGGATLKVFEEGGQQGAYAFIDGKVAAAGDLESVKAAVDSRGNGTFGSNDQFKAALDATTGDHVGFVYVAVRPLMDWAMRVGESTGTPGLSSEFVSGFIPDWAAFALRVEGDALRMESLAPKAADAPFTEAEGASVAALVPNTAIALSVSPSYGNGLLEWLDVYRSEPSMKEAIDAIDQALGVLGGPEAAAGWIGDFGVTVNRTADGVEGGLVIVPTDRAAADRFFTGLRTLASLGGSSLGVEVRGEEYAGTTITIVDLGNVGDLAGLAGVPSDMLGPSPAADAHIELAYAIRDDVVVIGSGPGFVRNVLDTTTETSLASGQRYKDLAGRAGKGVGTFADLTALRELFEQAMSTASPTDVAQYEQEVKPFLLPFDALVGSSSLQGDVVRNTVIVTVK